MIFLLLLLTLAAFAGALFNAKAGLAVTLAALALGIAVFLVATSSPEDLCRDRGQAVEECW